MLDGPLPSTTRCRSVCTPDTLSATRNPSLSAAQFVLTTAPNVGAMGDQLQYIYAALFVELVAKNPLYTPGEPFL